MRAGKKTFCELKCSKRCQIAEIGKTLESETRGNMFSSPSLQQLQKQRQSCFRLNVGNVSIIQVFRETKSQVPRTKCSGKLHLYDLIKYSIKISTNTSCVVWVHGKADFFTPLLFVHLLLFFMSQLHEVRYFCLSGKEIGSRQIYASTY